MRDSQKPIQQYAKYLNLLWFLGPGLIVAGWVILAIGNVQGPLSAILIGFGLCITMGGVFYLLGRMEGFWERRSIQTSANTIVATIAIIIILGLINFLAVRYHYSFDLTENKLFTISPQTRQLVTKLNQPLKVWVFEPNLNGSDRELLQNYQRFNSKFFSYELVDPQLSVALADRFKVEFRGEVHLEYNRKQQLVQTLREGESLSEVQLTNGIEKLLRDHQPQIYFLQGHGEIPLEQIEGGLYDAVAALREKGYAVEVLDLANQTKVPENADVLIIASPKRPLLIGEIEAIKTALKAGKGLLILLNPDSKPGLDLLLADWGITLDDRLIIDASGAGNIANLGPATPLVKNYGTHPITLDFNGQLSLYPYSRPVIIKETKGVEAVPIVTTGEDTWAEKDIRSETLNFDSDRDLGGPLNIGVALTRSDSTDSPSESNQEDKKDPEQEDKKDPEQEDKKDPEQEDKKEQETRLVVFGNANFATNGWFSQQLNSDVFLNSVKWLANEDAQILSIRPKEQKNRRLNLSNQQGALIGWSAIVIFPLSGFMGAGLIWWFRR